MSIPFRYGKLSYAALDVTNLDRSVGFYRDVLGLDLVSREGDTAFLRCSAEHHNIVLQQSTSGFGLRRVAFLVESADDYAKALVHFRNEGLGPVEVSTEELATLKQGPSFRVRVPGCGLEFEIVSKAMTLGRPFVPTLANIQRVGHVVIGTKEYDTTRAALTGPFGFAVSDFVEGRFTFLRCFPNPFHHTFAIGRSGENHLHHVNFMVTSIDDVGRAIHRLKSHDVKVVFGPGRHPPSGSVFLYFLDPDGMTVEYSFGMEEFPEDNAREPRMLEPVPQSLDTWGAPQDPQFAKNGRIVGAP